MEQRGPSAASTPISPHSGPHFIAPTVFDVSRHIKLVPPFREAEVDFNFCVFERVAAALNWPEECWPIQRTAAAVQTGRKGTGGVFQFVH